MAKITFPLLKSNGSPWKVLRGEFTQEQLCPGTASAQPAWVQVTCHSLSGRLGLVQPGMGQAGDPAGASWAGLETTPTQHQPQHILAVDPASPWAVLVPSSSSSEATRRGPDSSQEAEILQV